MLIFISGSINSGKTTTCNALAERLGAISINVDDLNDQIPDFNLATDLDKSMDIAIATINQHLNKGRDVIANYVLREKDFVRLKKEVHTNEQHIVTLSPQLSVATSQRGDRVLSDWEVQRVNYHYKTGIASPKFGHIVDNSTLSVIQTVDRILEIIQNEKH